MVKDNIKSKLDGNELDLSLMNLEEVPVKEIAAIPKATQIDLSCNRITFIPPALSQLKQIVRLDLSRNAIESLPDNFGELTKLQHLDLYANKLTSLPVSFSELKNLKWLDLKDNPLSPQLKAVAGDCLDAKQCQNSAKKVVSFMQSVQKELLIEVEKKLIREQEMEALRKAKEERALEQKRKAKKAAKQKKKSAAALATQKLDGANKVQNSTSDLYGISQTDHINGPKSLSGRKSGSGGFGAMFSLLAKFLAFLLMISILGFGIILMYTGGEISESSIYEGAGSFVKDVKKVYAIVISWLISDGVQYLQMAGERAAEMLQETLEIVSHSWSHVVHKSTVIINSLKSG